MLYIVVFGTMVTVRFDRWLPNTVTILDRFHYAYITSPTEMIKLLFWMTSKFFES